MTGEEAEAHFARKAKRLNLPDAAAAARHAEQRRIDLQRRKEASPAANADRVDPVTPIEDTAEQPMRQDQVIQARIIHLCRQVAQDIPDNDRMPANQFLDELESIEGGLGTEDMQYLVANGRYRSIIRWADIRLKTMLTGEAEEKSSAIIEDDIPDSRVSA
jgi:hypothetical protein